jgi:hypothetical protein
VAIIVGTWHFGGTQSDLPGDESPTAAAAAVRLHAATGLRVEQREDGTLRIPKLGRLTFLAAGEELFDWAFNDHTATVHSGIPAHPYLWENLDAVMRTAGAIPTSASGSPIRYMLDCERVGAPCHRAIASCLLCHLYGEGGLSIGCSHSHRLLLMLSRQA